MLRMRALGGSIHAICTDTKDKLMRKAFSTKSIHDQLNRVSTTPDMHRVLGAFDLTLLGIGGIVGAGVFVLTGVAANKDAGPAVVLSYFVASVAAVLSALCYAEFVAELPVAGGAYNYISATFGEFAAWLVACNLVLEYTLSSAAVARGFSAYTATLVGWEPADLIVGDSNALFGLDFLAALAVVLLSGLLAVGTHASARFNNAVTIANLVVIAFVLAAGAPHVRPANFKPFAPYGARGVFTGASHVFFSFIGFDMIVTAAEEVRNPAVDLPVGIITSLLICAVLYGGMSLVICGMVHYSAIDIRAPFSKAFQTVGMGWAGRVVSVGALLGITTSLLVGLLGQARVFLMLGRDRLLPAWLGKVNSKTGTPVNATLLGCVLAGCMALVVNIEELAELVSIGTLFVFFMVCMGVMVRRYHSEGTGTYWPTTIRLTAVTLSSIVFSVTYAENLHPLLPAACLVAWLAATVSFVWSPTQHVPQKFAVPLTPLLPCLGMLANIHLIGSLGWQAYARFGIWFVLSCIVYAAYSVHHSAEGAPMHTVAQHSTDDYEGGEGPADSERPAGVEVELNVIEGDWSRELDTKLLAINAVQSHEHDDVDDDDVTLQLNGQNPAPL